MSEQTAQTDPPPKTASTAGGILMWPFAVAGWITAAIVQPILNTFDYVGRFVIFVLKTLLYIITLQIPVGQTIQQMAHLGTDSLFIVTLCLGFTGMISATILAQRTQELGFGIQYLGGAVVYAMAQDLAPVLGAMVMAGRIGAGIASEIGSMKVTEQIDALRALAVPPIKHLVVPRVIALGLMGPTIGFIAGFVGVWAGWLPVGGLNMDLVQGVHLSHRMYFDSVFGVLDYKLLWINYKKNLIFGLIIAFISCLEGFETKGGAKGVGVTVTRAVVIAMVCVYIADLILTL